MPTHVRMTATREHGASDSEDDILVATPDQKQDLKPKAKPRGTRQPTKAGAKRKAAPKEPRKALKDRTNVQPNGAVKQPSSAAHDLDAEDDDHKAKRMRTSQEPISVQPSEDSSEKRAGQQTGSKKTGRRPREVPASVIASDSVTADAVPRTSPRDLEDVEQSIEVDTGAMDIESVPTPRQASRFVQRAQAIQAQQKTRSVSAQPPCPTARERSASASGTERRGGAPELRRKLNELTKKCESLRLKNEALQELGKDMAESNFERLKRSADERAHDASELITSLKKEIAELRKSSSTNAGEASSLHKEVTFLSASNSKLTVEANETKEQLQTARNEIKALEVKLAAARHQILPDAQEQKQLESGPRLQARANAMSTNEIQSLREAKMKEDLYADLTGLLIRGVKRKDGEDEYDCIQTGRNGTMHFHLSIANDSTTPHPKTPSGLSYEEAEFAYEPLLDDDRDKALLELLPDYLTEEICFPRNHAQRFYSKVVDSMTKRIVVEE